MSYADGLLSTGERIELRERQHWFILVWAGRWAIFAIIGALILVVPGQRAGPGRRLGHDPVAREPRLRRAARRRDRQLRLGGAPVPPPGVRHLQPARDAGRRGDQQALHRQLAREDQRRRPQPVDLRADVRVRRPRRPDRVGERDRALPDDPGPDRVQEGDARREARIRARNVAWPGAGQPAAARGARSAAGAKPGTRPGRDVLGQRPAARPGARHRNRRRRPRATRRRRRCRPTR